VHRMVRSNENRQEVRAKSSQDHILRRYETIRAIRQEKKKVSLTERTCCPLCHASLDHSRQLIHVKTLWVPSILKNVYCFCSVCGLVYDRYPMTNNPYYADASAFNGDIDPQDYLQEEFLRRTDWKWEPHEFKIEWLIEWADNRLFEDMKIVDVGTGDGSFVKLLKDKKFKALGVDPDTKYVEFAKKIFDVEIIPKPLQEAGLERESIDMVTALEVMEHALDPHELLQNMRNVLKESGLIFFTVPNIYRAHYNALGKGHTSLYTKSTLKQLLEANGFNVLVENERMMGHKWNDKIALLAEKRNIPKDYRFYNKDNFFKVKTRICLAAYRGNLEWFWPCFVLFLRTKLPQPIYSFLRRIYRIFKG
jgi:2-polyprenyl-3-methyl-5-hydroxy-6-metoxy-1,4-benzoquinol methylase